MGYREIVDDGGSWVIFSTRPHSGANVRPRYADGWLSFQRGEERRRLAPIPEGWESAGDAQLRLWLLDAELVTRALEDRESDPAERGAAETVPIAPPPPRVPTRVQKSVDRIRAMLRDIRSD